MLGLEQGGGARVSVGVSVGGSRVGLGRVGMRVTVGVGVTGMPVGASMMNLVGVSKI